MAEFLYFVAIELIDAIIVFSSSDIVTGEKTQTKNMENADITQSICKRLDKKTPRRGAK